MCLFGMFVLCPPTWRINTYIKAIAHMLRFCHSIRLPSCAVKVLAGVLRVGDPVLYVIYCHLCTKYELIRSFNTFCTCRHPYYVQKTYKTTYEFSACILPASPVHDVTRSFPASRRPGEHSLYLSGVLRGGDPGLHMIYFHLCTKYGLICSFNTFCTCIHPYYVQKTYKTTYEFIFSLHSPG